LLRHRHRGCQHGQRNDEGRRRFKIIFHFVFQLCLVFSEPRRRRRTRY
jgi:hypothetical protein